MSNELDRIASALERIATAIEQTAGRAKLPVVTSATQPQTSKRDAIRRVSAFVNRAPKRLPDGINSYAMACWFISAFGEDADPTDIGLWWKLSELRTVRNLGEVRRKRLSQWMYDCFGESLL